MTHIRKGGTPYAAEGTGKISCRRHSADSLSAKQCPRSVHMERGRFLLENVCLFETNRCLQGISEGLCGGAHAKAVEFAAQTSSPHTPAGGIAIPPDLPISSPPAPIKGAGGDAMGVRGTAVPRRGLGRSPNINLSAASLSPSAAGSGRVISRGQPRARPRRYAPQTGRTA